MYRLLRQYRLKIWKSISHWLTDSLTAWKQEMLAHLKMQVKHKEMEVVHKMCRFSSNLYTQNIPSSNCQQWMSIFLLVRQMQQKIIFMSAFLFEGQYGDATTPNESPPSTFHDCQKIWRSNLNSNFLGPLFAPFIHRHPLSSMVGLVCT